MASKRGFSSEICDTVLVYFLVTAPLLLLFLLNNLSLVSDGRILFGLDNKIILRISEIDVWKPLTCNFFEQDVSKIAIDLLLLMVICIAGNPIRINRVSDFIIYLVLTAISSAVIASVVDVLVISVSKVTSVCQY